MERYSLGIYEKALPETLTWKEKLAFAKEVGYDFMEMSIDETENRLSRLLMTKEERLQLVKTMYETNISIRSMCLSAHRKYPLGSKDNITVQKSLEIMEQAIALADDLGIRIIMLAGYDVYYEKSDEETKERFLNNLKKVAILASVRGVMLGFETMETGFMNTVSKAMQYVHRVASPYVQVYPDIGNIKNAAVTYESDVHQDLNMGYGHLIALHLKETVPGEFREVPYGTGHVDFEKAIATAWQLGVRRFVTEFWDTGNDNWKDDVVFAFRKMQTILNKQ